jgi:hypothetical protein
MTDSVNCSALADSIRRASCATAESEGFIVHQKVESLEFKVEGRKSKAEASPSQKS